ncbi:MAG: hypothetical protein V9F04_06420 [Dermatophilaceae bacterium]
MKAVLADIQNGAFAKRFIGDQDAGAPEFKDLRAKGAAAPDRGHRPRTAQAHELDQGQRLGLHRRLGRAALTHTQSQHARMPCRPRPGGTAYLSVLRGVRNADRAA